MQSSLAGQGHRVLSLILLSSCLGFLASVHAHASEQLSPETLQRLQRSWKVGDPLVAALDREERVRVVISFEVPGLARLQELGLPPSHIETARQRIREAGDSVLAVLGPGKAEVHYQFETISAIAATIDAEDVLRLLEHPRVQRVDLDEAGQGELIESRALTHVNDVLNRGYTGVGVTAAVIDSGIDSNHFDLSDHLVAERCFCSNSSGGCCPNGSSSQSGVGSAEDDNGHGTLVSGVITSRGSIAPRGAAPDTQIVAVKVLDRFNRFRTSEVIRGLDWVVNNRADVDVVNMSLGTDELFSGDCDNAKAYNQSLAQAINTLKGRNVPVFVASGNQGSSSQMASPACISNALSVAAVYDANIGTRGFGICTEATAADKVTCFSNTNARTDLLAPGGLMTGPGLGGGTTSDFGTSFAAPMAAACASDLMDATPGLTVAEIEQALKASSVWLTDPKNGRAFPRLECHQALVTTASTCVPSSTALCLNNGRFRVTVTWRTAQGTTGSGKVVTSSADSGVFWFFKSTNWEMMVKVLNGCPVNNRYWVYAAGVTDVEWTLRVTDTLTGQTKTYFNPLGQASCAVTDSMAFATCP